MISLTELRASKIDVGGVGLFAIVDIPEGTKIGNDNDGTWYSISFVRSMPKWMQKLVKKFGIYNSEDKSWWAPEDFTRISHVWYINNDNDSPNVSEDLRALRLIHKDEELTARYSDVVM